MENNKKWYMSKKFWTPIVVAIILSLNASFGWHLDAESIATIGTSGVLYLAGEFLLDRKRISNSNPLKDPLVIDAIDNVVDQLYDYADIKTRGIDVAAADIKTKALAALKLILDPDHLKYEKEIGQEIIRQVMKYFKEDKKLSEGAEAVKSQIKKVQSDQA